MSSNTPFNGNPISYLLGNASQIHLYVGAVEEMMCVVCEDVTEGA